MFKSVKVSARGSARVLVVAAFSDAPLDKATKALDEDRAIAHALKRDEATNTLGSILEAFPDSKSIDRVLIVGLGEKKSLTTAGLRNAGAAVARRLAALKATSAAIEISGSLSRVRIAAHDAGCAFAEGVGLVAWNYDDLRGSATDVPARLALSIKSDDAEFTKGMKRGLGLAEGSNIARTLSQTPPNIATPAWMASEAKKMARKSGMKCTVIQGKRLEDENLQGLINVGKASENAPCLIRIEYTPARAKRGVKPIVLLGKTITYDSGGLSIKVGGGMKGMKRDKDGGCAVFGAMHAIANVIKPNRPVVGLLVAAENSISDEAYRPDDVITFRNGVSVEVTNTDAEGRLVLADGLCWACDKENPEAIIDMATLTGGVVVALGSTYAGLWSDDEDLVKTLSAAGEATDERVWRLPLHSEYREMMRSPIADIVNSAPVREAHPIQGAAFLSYFVKENIRWAHVDIAGTHGTTKDAGCFIAGPTGFGARLAAEAVDKMSS